MTHASLRTLTFRQPQTLAGVTLCAAACAPLSAPPPLHFHETAGVLRRGQVALTASAGGGVVPLDGVAVGGGGRIRVGLGARQELGLEGTALYVDTGSTDKDSPNYFIGKSAAYGAKLSYKADLIPEHLALLLGAGGSRSATGYAAGGDLGLIASFPRPLARVLRPYLGARASFALPVDRPLSDYGGPTLVGTLAPGLAILPRPWLRIYLEVGLYAIGKNLGNPRDAMQVTPPLYKEDRAFGASGSVGVAFHLPGPGPST